MEIALVYMFMSGMILHALGFQLAGWILIAVPVGAAVIAAAEEYRHGKNN